MDPNQQPAPPTEPIQPSEPVTPAPEAQPAAEQPVSPLVDSTPATPPVFTTPVEPPSPAAASPTPAGPTFGSAPAGTAPANFTSGKSRKKLFILIGAIVGGVIVLGVAGYFIYTIFFNSLTLKSYSNDAYSLMVPASYTQSGDESDIKFTSPDKDVANQSTVEVSEVASVDNDKQDLIDAIDKSLTSDSINSNLSAGESFSNFKVDKSNYAGTDARLITGTLTKDGKTGSFYELFVFGDKEVYAVLIGALSGSGLDAKANTILHSFTIK